MMVIEIDKQQGLNARRAPVQDRSIRRVNRIMDVTAELVQEVGVDGVKTTEIARRAGIKLASLYRYFPNKNAILKSLAEHQFAKIHPRLKAFLQNYDLESGLDELIDAYADFYREEPGFTELWSGMQAIPELHQLDLDNLHRNASVITARIIELLPHLDEEDVRAIATVITRCTGAIIRLAITTEEPFSSAMLDEVKVMMRVYIKHRLSKQHTS